MENTPLCPFSFVADNMIADYWIFAILVEPTEACCNHVSRTRVSTYGEPLISFNLHPWLIVHLSFWIIQCWGPSNSLCGAFEPATDCVNVRWAACFSLAAHSNLLNELLAWVGYHVFCDVSPRRNHCAGQPAGWVDWFMVDSRSWSCDMDVTLSLHVTFFRKLWGPHSGH